MLVCVLRMSLPERQELIFGIRSVYIIMCSICIHLARSEYVIKEEIRAMPVISCMLYLVYGKTHDAGLDLYAISTFKMKNCRCEISCYY